MPTTDKTLYVLIGPPAVGKTTFTKESGIVDSIVINRDDIVEAVAAGHGLTYDEAYAAPTKDAQQGTLVPGYEKFGIVVPSDLTWRESDFELCRTIHREVKEQLSLHLLNASKEEFDVILDMTNLTVKDRSFYMQYFGDDFKKLAILFDFQGEKTIKKIKERCAKRQEELKQNGRSKNISDATIDRMIASYEPPSVNEGFDDIIGYDLFLLSKQNPKWDPHRQS